MDHLESVENKETESPQVMYVYLDAYKLWINNTKVRNCRVHWKSIRNTICETRLVVSHCGQSLSHTTWDGDE